MPACLRISSSRATSAAVAGHEGGAVAGDVALLGQGVDGQQALVAAPADARVEDARDRAGRRVLAPVELGVALVTGHDHTVLPGPGHHLGEVLDRQHLTGGVAGAVDPQQLRRATGGQRAQRREAQHRQGGRARDARAHVVRRVGHLGEGDDVTGTDPEQGRQPGHQLLAADRRQHPVGVDPGDAATAGEPGGDGLAQHRGAPRLGVAGGVGGVGERGPHHLGGRVHRGADREVDQPTDMGTRPLLERSERVPGKVRKLCHRPRRRAPAGAGRR